MFDKLTYSSFEKTLRPFCSGIITTSEGLRRNITAEYLDGEILLTSGLNEKEVERFKVGDGIKSFGIDKTALSKFRKGENIFLWIIDAYKSKPKEELLSLVKSSFTDKLMPYLQKGSAQNAKEAIYDIIKADNEISQDTKQELKKDMYGDDVVFLSKSFIIALLGDDLYKNDYVLNPVVQQVLSDIKVTGKSTLLNGLLDSLYQCAVEGLEVFDRMPYYQEDVIAFVIGVLPVSLKLFEGQQLVKFRALMGCALKYEINEDDKFGISSALNTIFEKYLLGRKRFEVTKIDIFDNGDTLKLEFKQKEWKPTVVFGKKNDLTPENLKTLSELLGVELKDLGKNFPGKSPNTTENN